MEKPKQTIKHELLNMFTIMEHLLSEKTVNENKRKKLLELLEISTLLIKHQEIFLKKKPHFFYQEISIHELCEAAFISAQQHEYTEGKIVLSGEKLSLSLDRFHLSEAFKQLFKKILKNSREIIIMFDPETCSLEIHHQGKMVLKRRNNTQFLDSKNREIGFQLGLEILKLCKIKISEKKGSVILSFPETCQTRKRSIRSIRKCNPLLSRSESAPFRIHGPTSHEDG